MSPDDGSLDGQGRNAVTPPDEWKFLVIFKGSKLTERNGLSARQRHLQIAETIQRDSLLVGRARHYIDEINVVADLGDGCAGYDSVQDGRDRLRTETEKARFVLVNANAHLAIGLHPIEINLFGVRIGGDDLSDLERDLAYPFHVRPADPILQWPSDRRSKLKGRNERNGFGKLLRQQLVELEMQALACGDILRDNDGLREEIVWELHIEGQIEANGTASDIGAPPRHIGIGRERRIQALRRRFARVD